MKFQLSTSGYYYSKDRVNDLKKYGFEFTKSPTEWDKDRHHINGRSVIIEINTLEELVEFSEKNGSPIIFELSAIEIYDDYRE